MLHMLFMFTWLSGHFTVRMSSILASSIRSTSTESTTKTMPSVHLELILSQWFIPRHNNVLFYNEFNFQTLCNFATAVAIFPVRQHPRPRIVHLSLYLKHRVPWKIERNHLIQRCQPLNIIWIQVTFSQLKPIVVTAFKYWSSLRRYKAVVFPAESSPSIATCNVP